MPQMDNSKDGKINCADVVVTGLGCISGLGVNFSECMTNLFQGRQNTGFPTRFSPEPSVLYPVFEIDDSRVLWIKHLQNRGRTAQLAAVAAAEALADAGMEVDGLAGKRVGVCIGTTVGNAMNNEEFYRQYRQGSHPDMFEMDRYFSSNPAEVIGEEFQLQGPVMTVANACSSGTDAIGMALSWLQADLCDIVLAGGSDELSSISYLGFASLMISSETPCSPFDKKRKGLNLGEGAAVLVLEKSGVNRGKEKCTVSSYASACDAYHLTAPHPEGIGLKKALGEALDIAGIGKEQIAFINAHGTGTQDNDRVEMQVFAEMFSETPYFSIKGCTGHTLGGAGGIEAAITVGCLVKGALPPSAGFTHLPEGMDNPPVTTEIPLLINEYALSQSLAFGGNNSVVIFRR